MEKEICYQINAQIINSISSCLFAYSYTDEEPGENVLVLQIGGWKTKVEMEVDLQKDNQGLLTVCQIKTTIKQEKKR